MKITLKTLDPAKIVKKYQNVWKEELPLTALSASCDGCEGLVDDVEEVESAGYNIESGWGGDTGGKRGQTWKKQKFYPI